MSKPGKRVNMFFSEAARVDKGLLGAARETELMIHDLRAYFDDVNAALKQVGSKTVVKDIKISRAPDNMNFDLMLTAVISSNATDKQFEFGFDIENRKVTASVRTSERPSSASSTYSYNAKDAMKKSLSKWVCEAIPVLDRVNLAADGTGAKRPQLS